jgi:hypothetical protein
MATDAAAARVSSCRHLQEEKRSVIKRSFGPSGFTTCGIERCRTEFVGLDAAFSDVLDVDLDGGDVGHKYQR